MARVLWLLCARCCQPRRGPFRFSGQATRLTPKGRVRVARREKSRSLLHVVCLVSARGEFRMCYTASVGEARRAVKCLGNR